MSLFKTTATELKEAREKLSTLETQLTELTRAKAASDRAAEDTKAAHDADVEKFNADLAVLNDAHAKAIEAKGKELADLKAASEEAAKQFEAKLQTEVARQLAAAGTEPLPIKPEETPASKPDAAEGLTGSDKLRAIYRQQIAGQ